MNLPPKSILIVDDEKQLARDYVELFALEGWRAEAVFSGEEAIEKIRSMAYDVVLLDLRMPGLGGMKTLPKILAIQPDVCIIFFTAGGDIPSAIQAVREGACSLVTKGLSFEDLSLFVSKELDKWRAKQRLQATERTRRIAESSLNLALGLAHQVKNRLAHIGARLVVVEKEAATKKAFDAIASVRSGLQMTEFAVRNLYRFSQTRQIQRVELSLAELIAEAWKSTKQNDRTRKTELVSLVSDVDESIVVLGDRMFFVEALECVFSNAVEAMQTGGRLEVSGDVHGAVFQLMVQDDGQGFDISMLECGVQPFTTTKGRTNIGFGLYFVKQVCECCGGSLEFGNRTGDSGAWVTMSLPLAR